MWGTLYYGKSADTYANRRLSPSSDAKAQVGRGQQASRRHRPRYANRLKESRSALVNQASFGYPG